MSTGEGKGLLFNGLPSEEGCGTYSNLPYSTTLTRESLGASSLFVISKREPKTRCCTTGNLRRTCKITELISFSKYCMIIHPLYSIRPTSDEKVKGGFSLNDIGRHKLLAKQKINTILVFSNASRYED